jgi:hypothetical protein
MNPLKDPLRLDILERFAVSFRADFRFAPVNIAILVVLCLAGLAIHLAVHPFELEAVISMVAVAVGLAVLFRFSQIWESVLVGSVLAALGVYLRHRPDSGILVTTVVVAGLLAPCLQVATTWTRGSGSPTSRPRRR